MAIKLPAVGTEERRALALAQDRDEQQRLLDALRTELRRAASFPYKLRRWLRVLEKEGRIECDARFFWHVVR